jgi:hypothetical protein
MQYFTDGLVCRNNVAQPADRNDVSEDSKCRNMNHLNILPEAINFHVKLRISTHKSRLSPRTTQRRMEGGEA